MRTTRTYGRLAAVPALLLAVTALGQAFGQSAPPAKNLPPLAKQEILRRGNLVERMGTINDDGPMPAIIGAFAPPPDDSHKWYISVITQRGCPACERLKTDLLRSEHLQAWVNVEHPESSWSHYSVFRWEDPTQRWRWQKIRVRAFPTIMIQPPRSGRYGPSSSVVFQKTGYDGDAEKLSREMSEAVRRYVTRIQARGEYDPNPAHELQLPAGGHQQAPAVPIGVDPPFDVDKVDPRYPTDPLPSIVPPAVDPDGQPKPKKPLPAGDLAAKLKQLKKALPLASSEFLLARLVDGCSIDQAVRQWWGSVEIWATRAVLALIVLLMLGCITGSAFWLRSEIRRSLPGASVTASADPSPSPNSPTSPTGPSGTGSGSAAA